jgi:hypothetical protein
MTKLLLILAEINADDEAMGPYFGKYSPARAAALQAHAFDRAALGGLIVLVSGLLRLIFAFHTGACRH